MALGLDTCDRDKRITIERATTTRDEMNAPVEVWGEYIKRWASISFGTGQERRQAAQESGSQAATFRMPSDNQTRTLTIRDRIQFMDAAWDITSVVPFGSNEGVDVTAVRAA
jgi:head-tail adaptor